ncbi:PQQ-binding-like beta-propeller repeat protein [Cohnella soli]|uniref:PQQ-binding-like beta-propeller repeat protein n=1 Tax=Cohnella soli TaxID=425005 RepID=A0ABW0I2U7_9BACL
MKAKFMLRALLVMLLVGALGVTTVTAATPAAKAPTRLPAKEYKELKYVNDRGEKLKFYGYKQFKIAWTKEMTDPTDIVMNTEKTRIFVTNGNEVIAYELSGKEVWRYELPDMSFNYYQLHIGADGTIYAIEQPENLLGDYKPGYVAALSDEGELRWEITFEDQRQAAWMSYSGSSEGTFVTFTDNGIVGVRDGEIVWTTPDILEITTHTSGTYSFSFPNVYHMFSDYDGTTFVTTDDQTYALDDEGNVLWNRSFEGDIVLVNDDEFLLQILPAGGWKLWDALTGKQVNGVVLKPEWLKGTNVANDGAGGLYVSNMNQTKKNGISKIDAKGKTLWSYNIRFSGYSDAYEIGSDAGGNVFFTDSGGTFYSLDRNGNERFIFLYRNQYGPDSTKAVADFDGNVYALFSNIGLIKVAKIAK